jgi:L-alanine-DL-glutamate epimerase-like enolase superfamily enzyme
MSVGEVLVSPAAAARIDRIGVRVLRIPTDRPESDGTLEWDSTTMVLVEAAAGGITGIGWSYADAATARLVRDTLAGIVEGRDAMSVAGSWQAMVHAIRNLGRPGIASMAISAVDIALWDLKARLLGLPLVDLLGSVRDGVPIYGSGGFTSYTDDELRDQLGGWAAQGLRFVKMKVGRQPGRDGHRADVAREAIGPDVELFVDANGAYERAQAIGMAEDFGRRGVAWFEEPVSSDDLDGLRLVRDRAPGGMAVAAGEYGYDAWYFRRMLEAGAVDVLQADATRCGGITGFVNAAALCAARSMRLSAHCAPALHVHPGCALEPVVHLEYFHDHERIERMLFDGVPDPRNGRLHPDRSRPGMGLEVRQADAARWELS